VKLICPQCQEASNPFRSKCPKCGHDISFGKLFKERFRLARQRMTDLRLICYQCQHPNPFRAAKCESCGASFAISFSLEKRENLLIGYLTDARKIPRYRQQKWLQNIYMLISAGLMYGAVELALRQAHYFKAAALSIVHISMFLLFIKLIVPRQVFAPIFILSWRVRLGMVLNFLASILVFQCLVSNFLSEAMLIAGLFFTVWAGARLFVQWVYPIAEAIAGIFLTCDNHFDVDSPQGRSVRIE